MLRITVIIELSLEEYFKRSPDATLAQPQVTPHPKAKPLTQTQT